MKDKPKYQIVEFACPKCHDTKIAYIPKEKTPTCPRCKVQMIVKELLTEGKSY